MAKRGLVAGVAAVMWVAACGGGGGSGTGTGSSPSSPPPPPAPQNQAPVADAGEDISMDIPPAGVQLDGTASSDPEGQQLTYSWAVASRPAGGDGTFDDAAVAQPVFRTGVPGDFEIRLTVTDPDGASGYDDVIVSLTNTPPDPVAEVSLANPAVGDEVQLSGLSSTDPNGQPLTFLWKLESAPAGTAVPEELTGAVQTVVFDLEGEYRFSLSVSDGVETVKTDAPLVSVSKYSIQKLDQSISLFAVQPGGGRIVTTSGSILATYEPDGEVRGVVTVPQPVQSVSVSPDGKLAITGHSGAVTFVDLESQQVLATYTVDPDVGDVLVTNEGFGYVFSSSNIWTRIKSLDSRNGAQGSSTGNFPTLGAQVKMHPDGRKAYSTSRLLTPADVERYDFASSGQAAVAYDSPYHGDYQICGDLWISESGSDVLTRCGVVFRATDTQSTDMTFAMQIGGVDGLVDSASYGAPGNYWFLIESQFQTAEPDVRVVYADSGTEAFRLDMPLTGGTAGSQLYARHVVARQDQNSVLIFAQDDPTTPQNYYLVKYRVPAAAALDLPPEIRLQKYSAGKTSQPVVVDAGGSFDPEGMSLSFDWTLVSQPDLSNIVPTGMQEAAIHFTPVVAGLYVFEVAASDGQKTSGPERVTVNVGAPGDRDFYRFEGDVTDAEYSKSLNILAYISDEAAVLHLLHMDDYTETEIVLPRTAYRVGISLDGKYAAVSHAALVSLVDLTAETVIDTQETSTDWGDIVLDRNLRAHLVPVAGSGASFVTVDFAADSFSNLLWYRRGQQLRMHPNGVWVYGADPNTSSSSFSKWDVSQPDAVYKGDAATNGTYLIRGNLWVSEDGDDIVVKAGDVYNASSDPLVDMRRKDGLPVSIMSPGLIIRPRSENGWRS